MFSELKSLTHLFCDVCDCKTDRRVKALRSVTKLKVIPVTSKVLAMFRSEINLRRDIFNCHEQFVSCRVAVLCPHASLYSSFPR